MNFLITLSLTFVLIMLALMVFRYVGLPVYRVEAVNVQTLIELVLAGQATESDWDVFIGMPIRHNPALDDIRQQCAMLAEREMTSSDGLVCFSSTGRAELSLLLQRLDNELSHQQEHHHD